MGLIEDQIKDQMDQFASRRGPKVILSAEVTAINADTTIAVVFPDGSMMEDVRLKAVVKDGNELLLIPAVGSTVLVGKIRNEEEYVVLAVDEISEIKVLIGTVTFDITQDGMLMQKGTDTLLDALVTFIESIEPVVIMEGTNPDFVKLAQAKAQIQNLLR